MSKKLQKFLELKDNWNGYGAKVFDKEYLQKVDDFISKLKYEPEIFPLPEGEVQLEYEDANSYFEIELHKDGTMTLYKTKDGAKSTEKIYSIWDIEIIHNI